MRHFLSIVFLFSCFLLSGQSGGILNEDQAAFDVQFYQLDLNFDIETRSIKGAAECRVEIVESIDTLELDLWDNLNVDSILVEKNGSNFDPVAFTHQNKKLRIYIPGSCMPEDLLSAKVFYNGTPHHANTPPWDDGFTWRQYSQGIIKMGVTCESEGGDVWFPCKDHPSDEPDSVALNFTVPDSLDCISNGKLIDVSYNNDSTATFHWYLASPINNYNITFYISQYELFQSKYWSVIGDSIPMKFWVSSTSYDALDNMDSTFENEFEFLEQTYGAYPFLTEKLGFAHSSYVGMEHQTIVAYGSNFSVNSWGYDYMHYHELAHEWWGNFITAKDWADTWIHEGMATYAEALRVEHLSGLDRYLQFMDNMRPSNTHSQPLAPREPITADFAFDHLDTYSRGASVLHTLRYHLGDEVFMRLLKRWTYPDSTDYDNTNGRQCRILNTDEMMYAAEDITGRSLEPFFEVFFREVYYPLLTVTRESDYATFEWTTETEVLLDLNVPVTVNGESMDVLMNNGIGQLNIGINDTLIIDPQKWILMRRPQILVGVSSNIDGEGTYFLSQNYPNPFNSITRIKFKIPTPQKVNISVYNGIGQKVTTIVNRMMQAGTHNVELNEYKFNTGIYFYTISAGGFTETKQFIVQ